MPIRSGHENLLRAMLECYKDEEAWLIYSMWNGYAKKGKEYTNENILNIRDLFGDRIYDGTYDGFHTSGHADIETLEEVCTLVKPTIGVIPIHKEENTQYNMDRIKKYKIFTASETVSDKVSITIE